MPLPPDSTSVVEFPGPWRHRYIAANGARFHVAEALSVAGAGDAPLVLLLHGFPEFWWSWRAQLPVLAAAGYRAVAMDLRGYGGSDKPPRGYDPFTLAGDVAGVVKALGERRAVLIGHGWGGYVGWTTAVLHPRETVALCAVSSPHPRVMLTPVGSRDSRALVHLLAMQVPFLPERRISRPSSGYVRAHLRAWSSAASSFPDEDAVRRYDDALRLWPASHCALEYHRWLVRSRLRADGRRFNAVMEQPVTVPVCTVHGADDPAVPTARVSERSARWVSAAVESHVVAGAGHFPHEESPGAFEKVLLGWLGGLGRS